MIYLKCFTVSAKKNLGNYRYDLTLTYSLLKMLATIINGNCGLTGLDKHFWIIYCYNLSYNNQSFNRETNSPKHLLSCLFDFFMRQHGNSQPDRLENEE
jgi:hypothetical protein